MSTSGATTIRSRKIIPRYNHHDIFKLRARRKANQIGIPETISNFGKTWQIGRNGLQVREQLFSTSISSSLANSAMINSITSRGMLRFAL